METWISENFGPGSGKENIPFNELVLPGTHHSGMYKMEQYTKNKKWAQSLLDSQFEASPHLTILHYNGCDN